MLAAGAAGPVEFQVMNTPKFRIACHEGTTMLQGEGGGKCVGIGNWKSALQDGRIPDVILGRHFDCDWQRA